MNHVILELEKISSATDKSFVNLSPEQLNWKPHPGSWSIGQCLDHLIKSNEAFDREFQFLAKGHRNPSFLKKYSPLTGFFGNFLLKSMKNDAKKFKAPTKAIVPPSDLPADIVEKFTKHQKEFIERIKSIEHIDLHDVVITSPFLQIVTYRFDIALEIAVEHEKAYSPSRKGVGIRKFSEIKL